MKTSTIVKTTKDYLLLKVPLPQGAHFEVGPVRKNRRLTRAEKWLWKIIQEGEREYREGKTIAARSSDEALKQYERRTRQRH